MEKYTGNFSPMGFIDPSGNRVGRDCIHNTAACKIANSKYKEEFDIWCNQNGFNKDNPYKDSRTIGTDFLICIKGYDSFTKKQDPLHYANHIISSNQNVYEKYFDLLLENPMLVVIEVEKLIYDEQEKMYLADESIQRIAAKNSDGYQKTKINEIRRQKNCGIQI